MQRSHHDFDSAVCTHFFSVGSDCQNIYFVVFGRLKMPMLNGDTSDKDLDLCRLVLILPAIAVSLTRSLYFSLSVLFSSPLSLFLSLYFHPPSSSCSIFPSKLSLNLSSFSLSKSLILHSCQGPSPLNRTACAISSLVLIIAPRGSAEWPLYGSNPKPNTFFVRIPTFASSKDCNAAGLTPCTWCHCHSLYRGIFI